MTMRQAGERPLGELFSELASETATLVRHEVALAKVELTNKAKQATRDAAMVAVGGVVALLGAMALVAGAILVLGLVLPLWAAALIVGALVGGLGAALTLGGLKSLRELDPAPRQMIRTMKENKRWLQQQVSR